MEFNLWKSHIQVVHFGVLIALTPLGVLVMTLRFVATRRCGRAPGLEDWFAFLATFFCVMMNICSVIAVRILNGHSTEDQAIKFPEEFKTTRRWTMVALYMYFAHTMFVKLGVLALLYRVFGVKRAYRIWIYVLSVCQIGLCSLFAILQGFHCKPFQRYFDRRIPGTCASDGTTILTGEIPNSLIDFAIVALAMVMIRRLQLTSTMKWRLRFLFGLGALVGIIGFIKIGITYINTDYYSFSHVAIWTSVQMFVSLLCCCLPVFHPLLPKKAFWSNVTSKFSGRPNGYLSGGPTINNEASRSRGVRDGESQQQVWKYSEVEAHNTSITNLAWPEATHQTEVHALSDFSEPEGTPEGNGIKVHRRIDIN